MSERIEERGSSGTRGSRIERNEDREDRRSRMEDSGARIERIEEKLVAHRKEWSRRLNSIERQIRAGNVNLWKVPAWDL